MPKVTHQRAQAYFKNTSRKELISYLESWGTACYDEESTTELREAAVEHATSEGGFHYGPSH